MRAYYVYIMTNASRTLYTGMTNDLVRRVYQHRNHMVAGFTKRYNVTWLVYYEEAGTAEAALNREKQIKGWRRSRKLALVETMNPTWKDLSQDWYD